MKNHNKIIVLLALIIFITACSKVPISGRRQFKLLPESMIMGLSLDSYKQFLSENQVIKTGADAEMVKRVGNNVAAAVESYFGKSSNKKIRNLVKDFKWEFNLVDSKDVNAWCMPGGKVVVYTGLLPITQNETALAVVLGHEIAHALAQHGNERMSQGLISQLGGLGLAIAMQNKPQQTQDLFLQSYGVGSSLGLLAYGRKQETEADKIGLITMAMAGYDPNESIPFWERMSKAGGANVPEILSTHPSSTTRIKDLRAYMPTAMRYYNKNANKNNKPSKVGNTPTNSNTNTQPTNTKTKTDTKTSTPGKTAIDNKTNTKEGNKTTPPTTKPKAPIKPK